MTKERKNKLVEKYMTKDIPAITNFQKSWIRKETAHHIVARKDENGNVKYFCTSCMSEVDLGKTKHKQKAICPCCKKELEVHHAWRNSQIETIDWIAIPRVTSGDVIMMRYILARRVITPSRFDEEITELARMVFTPDMTGDPHTFELRTDINGNSVWSYFKANYFAEYSMYNYRKWCCLPAEPYRPTWKRELKKISTLKYFDDMTEFINDRLYVHRNVWLLANRGGLYEKLCKAGLRELAKRDFYACNHYDSRIEFNNKETSLLKMLGLNRNQLNILKNNQTIDDLNYIKQIPDIDQNFLDTLKEAKVSHRTAEEITENGINLRKAVNYINRTKVNPYEWLHYMHTLKRLDYTLDDSYLFPKDFRKEDTRVADEFDMMNMKMTDGIHNKLISEISIALHNNKELMEFFKGSNGLQVFVPESAGELRREGRHLHNCLGTYVERYAEGKTLIFFVRRIEDPTAPYIALEYCHGKIVQCRYDHNKEVKDEKIIDFVNALANKLAESGVLAA